MTQTGNSNSGLDRTSQRGGDFDRIVDEERLRGKLKKLIAVRDNAERIGDLAQAKMFSMRISELLAKYDIAEDEIVDPSITVMLVDPIYYELARTFGRINWMLRLGTCVAQACGTRLIFPEDRKNNQVIFVGTKRDIKLSVKVFIELTQLGLSMARAELSIHKKSTGSGGRGWRESFVEAFADAVVLKFQSVETLGWTRTCPIDRVNEFLAENYGYVPHVKEVRDDAVKHQVAADKGKLHGQSVPISNLTTSTSRNGGATNVNQ